MRINAAITLPKDVIMEQSREEVKIQVSEHLAHELAKQIVKLVHKEIETIHGPSFDDPFDTHIVFKIEAELTESDNKRIQRMKRDMSRVMVGTPYDHNPFMGRTAEDQRQQEDMRRQMHEAMRMQREIIPPASNVFQDMHIGIDHALKPDEIRVSNDPFIQEQAEPLEGSIDVTRSPFGESPFSHGLSNEIEEE